MSHEEHLRFIFKDKYEAFIDQLCEHIAPYGIHNEIFGYADDETVRTLTGALLRPDSTPEERLAMCIIVKCIHQTATLKKVHGFGPALNCHVMEHALTALKVAVDEVCGQATFSDIDLEMKRADILQALGSNTMPPLPDHPSSVSMLGFIMDTINEIEPIPAELLRVLVSLREGLASQEEYERYKEIAATIALVMSTDDKAVAEGLIAQLNGFEFMSLDAGDEATGGPGMGRQQWILLLWLVLMLALQVFAEGSSLSSSSSSSSSSGVSLPLVKPYTGGVLHELAHWLTVVVSSFFVKGVAMVGIQKAGMVASSGYLQTAVLGISGLISHGAVYKIRASNNMWDVSNTIHSRDIRTSSGGEFERHLVTRISDGGDELDTNVNPYITNVESDFVADRVQSIVSGVVLPKWNELLYEIDKAKFQSSYTYGIRDIVKLKAGKRHLDDLEIFRASFENLDPRYDMTTDEYWANQRKDFSVEKLKTLDNLFNNWATYDVTSLSDFGSFKRDGDVYRAKDPKAEKSFTRGSVDLARISAVNSINQDITNEVLSRDDISEIDFTLYQDSFEKRIAEDLRNRIVVTVIEESSVTIPQEFDDLISGYRERETLIRRLHKEGWEARRVQRYMEFLFELDRAVSEQRGFINSVARSVASAINAGDWVQNVLNDYMIGRMNKELNERNEKLGNDWMTNEEQDIDGEIGNIFLRHTDNSFVDNDLVPKCKQYAEGVNNAIKGFDLKRDKIISETKEQILKVYPTQPSFEPSEFNEVLKGSFADYIIQTRYQRQIFEIEEQRIVFIESLKVSADLVINPVLPSFPGFQEVTLHDVEKSLEVFKEIFTAYHTIYTRINEELKTLGGLDTKDYLGASLDAIRQNIDSFESELGVLSNQLDDTKFEGFRKFIKSSLTKLEDEHKKMSENEFSAPSYAPVPLDNGTILQREMDYFSDKLLDLSKISRMLDGPHHYFTPGYKRTPKKEEERTFTSDTEIGNFVGDYEGFSNVFYVGVIDVNKDFSLRYVKLGANEFEGFTNAMEKTLVTLGSPLEKPVCLSGALIHPDDRNRAIPVSYCVQFKKENNETKRDDFVAQLDPFEHKEFTYHNIAELKLNLDREEPTSPWYTLARGGYRSVFNSDETGILVMHSAPAIKTGDDLFTETSKKVTTLFNKEVHPEDNEALKKYREGYVEYPTSASEIKRSIAHRDVVLYRGRMYRISDSQRGGKEFLTAGELAAQRRFDPTLKYRNSIPERFKNEGNYGRFLAENSKLLFFVAPRILDLAATGDVQLSQFDLNEKEFDQVRHFYKIKSNGRLSMAENFAEFKAALDASERFSLYGEVTRDQLMDVPLFKSISRGIVDKAANLIRSNNNQIQALGIPLYYEARRHLIEALLNKGSPIHPDSESGAAIIDTITIAIWETNGALVKMAYEGRNENEMVKFVGGVLSEVVDTLSKTIGTMGRHDNWWPKFEVRNGYLVINQVERIPVSYINELILFVLPMVTGYALFSFKRKLTGAGSVYGANNLTEQKISLKEADASMGRNVFSKMGLVYDSNTPYMLMFLFSVIFKLLSSNPVARLGPPIGLALLSNFAPEKYTSMTFFKSVYRNIYNITNDIQGSIEIERPLGSANVISKKHFDEEAGHAGLRGPASINMSNLYGETEYLKWLRRLAGRKGTFGSRFKLSHANSPFLQKFSSVGLNDEYFKIDNLDIKKFDFKWSELSRNVTNLGEDLKWAAEESMSSGELDHLGFLFRNPFGFAPDDVPQYDLKIISSNMLASLRAMLMDCFTQMSGAFYTFILHEDFQFNHNDKDLRKYFGEKDGDFLQQFGNFDQRPIALWVKTLIRMANLYQMRDVYAHPFLQQKSNSSLDDLTKTYCAMVDLCALPMMHSLMVRSVEAKAVPDSGDGCIKQIYDHYLPIVEGINRNDLLSYNPGNSDSIGMVKARVGFMDFFSCLGPSTKDFQRFGPFCEMLYITGMMLIAAHESQGGLFKVHKDGSKSEDFMKVFDTCFMTQTSNFIKNLREGTSENITVDKEAHIRTHHKKLFGGVAENAVAFMTVVYPLALSFSELDATIVAHATQLRKIYSICYFAASMMLEPDVSFNTPGSVSSESSKAKVEEMRSKAFLSGFGLKGFPDRRYKPMIFLE